MRGVREGLGQRNLLLLAVRDHALEVAALLDELEAVDGADPLDAVAVVAAEEDAEVDELVVGEVEADERRLQAEEGASRVRQKCAESRRIASELRPNCARIALRLQVDLEDGQLRRLGLLQVAEQDRRAERERVHVLGARRVHEARLADRRARRLRLARRVEDGDAHQPEQRLHLLRLLARRAHQPLLLALDVLGRAALLGELRQLGLRRLLPLLPLRELAALHRRRLAVEDEDGLDPILHQPDRAVEHAGEVARHLARLVRQLALAARLPHRDQELVDRHGRVDRDLPPKVVLELVLLDRVRRVVRDEAREALDAHRAEICSARRWRGGLDDRYGGGAFGGGGALDGGKKEP